MKTKIAIILSVLILISSLFFFLKTNKDTSPIYCKIANDISNEFLQGVYEKYGFKCYGSGGRFAFNVKEIFLALTSNKKKLCIDESRVLFVNCTEDLLKRVNTDERIRPYLDHYPFTYKGINVTQSFIESNGKRVSNDFITYVSKINGRIYYRSYDHEKDELQDIYNEPYEEAFKIVKEQGLLEISSQ